MRAYNHYTWTEEDYNFYYSLSNKHKIMYIHDLCLLINSDAAKNVKLNEDEHTTTDELKNDDLDIEINNINVIETTELLFICSNQNQFDIAKHIALIERGIIFSEIKLKSISKKEYIEIYKSLRNSYNKESIRIYKILGKSLPLSFN